MANHIDQVMQAKEIIRRAMDTCKNTINGVTPMHIMVALAAEAGSGMATLPGEAKGKMFGACVTVMGQEAGLPVAAMQMPGGGDNGKAN